MVMRRPFAQVGALALAALAVAGLGGRARADEVVVGGVVATVPAGWSSSEDGKLRVLSAPRAEITVQLIVITESTLERGLRRVERDLGKHFEKIVWDARKPRAGKVAGMKTLARSGDAALGKLAVKLGVMLVQPRRGRPVMVMMVAGAATFASHVTELGDLMLGLRPAK